MPFSPGVIAALAKSNGFIMPVIPVAATAVTPSIFRNSRLPVDEQLIFAPAVLARTGTLC
jgi:hypothetical protein